MRNGDRRNYERHTESKLTWTEQNPLHPTVRCTMDARKNEVGCSNWETTKHAYSIFIHLFVMPN